MDDASPRVRLLSVQELQTLIESGESFELLDVRTYSEWCIARIEGARLLDDEVFDRVLELESATPLVFICHHGIRSRAAAEHFLARGFSEVYNVEGGIDAWSREIDPRVPRY